MAISAVSYGPADPYFHYKEFQLLRQASSYLGGQLSWHYFDDCLRPPAAEAYVQSSTAIVTDAQARGGVWETTPGVNHRFFMGDATGQVASFSGDPTEPWALSARGRITAAIAGGSYVICGLVDRATASTVEAMFGIDQAADGDHWVAHTNHSTPYYIDGPATDTNFHRFWLYNDGALVHFLVDGVEVGTLSSSGIDAATPSTFMIYAAAGNTWRTDDFFIGGIL